MMGPAVFPFVSRTLPRRRGLPRHAPRPLPRNSANAVEANGAHVAEIWAGNSFPDSARKQHCFWGGRSLRFV